jgi:hypothetical protein
MANKAPSEKNQTKSKQSNGRGGKRANAGRKVGSATKKTREIAEKAMAEGITPLEFMLDIMRTEPDGIEDAKLLADMQVMRFEAAKAAAPYIHPRLAAVEHSGGLTVRTLAEELASLNAGKA